MNRAKPIVIRVIDENGSPVRGALVSVLRSTAPYPEIALVTDSEGIVRMFPPDGLFVIGAHADGKQGIVEIDVEISAGWREIDLTLR